MLSDWAREGSGLRADQSQACESGDGITREFLHHFEDEINRARYEINEQYMDKPHSMSIGHESKFLHYADRTVEVPLNQFETEKPQMATIAEQLKAARAKLAEARDGAVNAIAQSDDASKVVLGEVNKVLKEAEDLRAEVAELTNGGPA